MDLFDPSINATDDDYRILRNTPEHKPQREFVRDLWARYRPYADQNFVSEIAANFQARFWEMYLACALMDQGHQLDRSTYGPDICLTENNRRIWIEAVTSSAGTGPDCLTEPGSGPFFVPDDQIVFRYAESLDTKWKQYQERLCKGRVQPSEPYVIAVNDFKVPMQHLGGGLPRIVRAVLPVGRETEVVDQHTGRVLQRLPFRPCVRKKSGSPVSTFLFGNSEYDRISAVLYSAVTVWTPRPHRLDEDFLLIHNHGGRNCLPRGWIRHGVEYKMRGQRIEKETFPTAEA